MKNFSYYKPDSAEAAVSLLDEKWGGSEMMAGGTDLLDLQKEHILEPDKVVSLSGIDNLDRIQVHTKIPPIIEIGSGATLADIAKQPVIKQYCPALAQAAAEAGTPQIRNMGTIGGNLCQRNRCWYFRDEHAQCLLKGGDKCFALDGENRYHAIFTRGQNCVCVNPSTLAPALMVLGAKATVIGPGGKKRTIPLTEFFRTPSSEKDREHVLQPNEMVVMVSIQTEKFLRNASYEVRHKIAYDWPLVHACAAFDMEGEKVKNVRISLGHVAPTPIMSKEAAEALEGKEVNDETATAAGEAATTGAKPLSQNAYKVKLVTVAVKRAILMAAGKKRYWEV